MFQIGIEAREKAPSGQSSKPSLELAGSCWVSKQQKTEVRCCCTVAAEELVTDFIVFCAVWGDLLVLVMVFGLMTFGWESFQLS